MLPRQHLPPTILLLPSDRHADLFTDYLGGRQGDWSKWTSHRCLPLWGADILLDPCVWLWGAVAQVSLMLHVAVPELRSSTFGWMKCSHLFSMLWSYSILFVVYLWGLDLVTRYPASCRFLGGFHACATFRAFRTFFLFLVVLRIRYILVRIRTSD
jgi:hypothetical protein